jgi:hypothetical protein
MSEKEQEYIELYPIYHTLLQEVKGMLQKENEVTVGFDNFPFVDCTFGKIVFSGDISNVTISYHLESFKYRELFRQKLFELYSNYCGVRIYAENIENSSFKQSCNLVVRIDCLLNKDKYIQLDDMKKQELFNKAVSDIKNGLVVFEDKNNYKR